MWRVILKYAYVRVSTNAQADTGIGILSQEMTTRKMLDRIDDKMGEAKYPEITKPGYFVDVISAYCNPLFDRAAGKAMFNVLDDGDSIVLARLDRGFRTVGDFCNFVALAQKYNWNLVCAEPQIDLSTPNGRMCAAQYALMAQWESDIKGQRIKDGLAAKKARNQQKVADADEDFGSETSEYRPQKRFELMPVAEKLPPGRVFIYIRCSHRSSVESGLGLRYQVERCCDYADALVADNPNLTFDQVIYTDAGVSALNLDVFRRQNGKRLNKELKPGDIVVCLRPDRVFGSVRDMSQTLQDWSNREVDIHFAEDGMRASSPAGKMMLSIMVAFSEMERQLASTRAKESRLALEADGKYAGGVGYPPFWMGIITGKQKKRLVLDRRQIVTYRLIELLIYKGMKIIDALMRVEELIAKRENRKPMPFHGVMRRGYWAQMPKYYVANKNGLIFPMWTRNRHARAKHLWPEARDLWRSKVLEEKAALTVMAERMGLHRPVMKTRRKKCFVKG